MTPVYGDTYVVSMAFVDKFPEPAPRLAEQLQAAYDECVAGWFNWERMGRVTVLHLERQIAEDEEVLDDKGLVMTPNTVVAQLIIEFLEARGRIPEGESDDQYNQLTTIITALESREEVKVAGLPCQYPSMTVSVTVSFEHESGRTMANEPSILEEAAKKTAEKLQGDLVSFKVEPSDGQA